MGHDNLKKVLSSMKPDSDPPLCPQSLIIPFTVSMLIPGSLLFSFQQHTLWLDCSLLCFPCESKGSFICAATQMSKVTLVHLKWNQMECMEWSVCLLLAKISSFLIPVKINMTLSVWCFTHTQTSLWVRVGVKGSRFWACVSVGLRNSPDKMETDMHICSFL